MAMESLRINSTPQFKNATLVVGWQEDAADLGTNVIDYLTSRLECDVFAEIEPFDFFPLGGVFVQDDVINFPESKFFFSRKKADLAIFKSNAPRASWFKFLNAVLDVAINYCHTKEIYTIGGMVSLSAHTTPREILAFSNSISMKEVLSGHKLDQQMDYETPPGQRPTLSSYLLWVARNRNINAASLWVPIPFYLLPTEDPAACKKIVEFLASRLGLDINLRDLDESIKKQSERIARVRFNYPEVDNYIKTLESNLSLNQDESEKLVKEIEQFLKKMD